MPLKLLKRVLKTRKRHLLNYSSINNPAPAAPSFFPLINGAVNFLIYRLLNCTPSLWHFHYHSAIFLYVSAVSVHLSFSASCKFSDGSVCVCQPITHRRRHNVSFRGGSFRINWLKIIVFETIVAVFYPFTIRIKQAVFVTVPLRLLYAN